MKILIAYNDPQGADDARDDLQRAGLPSLAKEIMVSAAVVEVIRRPYMS